MSALKVIVTRNPGEFLEHAGGFLRVRPIEHNVLATVVTTLEPSESREPPLFAWAEAAPNGELSAAVLRTPPRRLLASTMPEDAAEALMPKLLQADPELPGVNGPEPAASYLAEAWRRSTGGTVEPGMSQGIYWLSQVDEPPWRPAGRPRAPDGAERELLIQW